MALVDTEIFFTVVHPKLSKMALKFVVLALTLAYVNAGELLAQPALHYSPAPAVSSSYFQQSSAPLTLTKTIAAQPVAYQAAPAAITYSSPHVGLTQQSVTRSLGGAQSLSTYAKAVDSAYSSVRKYDTRFTNDAVSVAPTLYAKTYAAPAPSLYTASAPSLYAAPAPSLYAAPAPSLYAAPAPAVYGAPLVHKAASPIVYGAPAPLITKTYAAPAPLVSYAAPAPVFTKTYTAHSPVVSYAAPAQVYSQAPVLTKTYAAPAPVVSYGTPAASYGAPTLSYGAPAQLVAKAVSAPVVSKAAVAYSPAEVVAHTNFQGYGIEYHY